MFSSNVESGSLGRFQSLELSYTFSLIHTPGQLLLSCFQSITQSHRHGKDDTMISPQIILNHHVELITQDDLPGNEAKQRKSLPNGRRQTPLLSLVVLHLVRLSRVLGAFPRPCWTPTGPTGPLMEITAPTSIQAFTALVWKEYGIFDVGLRPWIGIP